MKRKIHMELLIIAALAIVLTLLFALFVFYGLFQEQIIGDLREDAIAFRSMNVFADPEDLDIGSYQMEEGGLRITLVDAEGDVIFDSDANEAAMESHEDRPEVQAAFETGEGHDTRKSETLDQNSFYYAVLLDNGLVLRVAREADSIFAVTKNMLVTVAGVFVLLFIFTVVLSNYFTKSLVQPIEELAENLGDPGTKVVYKELAPFVAKIRQQHEDILKNAKMRQEFTANVSHELKTPLTAISGYAELIEHGMAGKENTERFAGEIHKNASRLLILINDIIQLSQLDGGKIKMEEIHSRRRGTVTLKIRQDLSIGENLRRLRDRAGLTQEQVAAQLQVMGLAVSREMLSQMERGKYNIRVSELKGLKEIYKVQYEDFFEGI